MIAVQAEQRKLVVAAVKRRNLLRAPSGLCSTGRSRPTGFTLTSKGLRTLQALC